jgi:hypothetical protein
MTRPPQDRLQSRGYASFVPAPAPLVNERGYAFVALPRANG